MTKNVGAAVWLPSENEWYKAAYIGSLRGLRGGSWGSFSTNLAASNRLPITPLLGDSDVGFRVAGVPEPSSVLMTFLAVAGSLTRRRRDSL